MNKTLITQGYRLILQGLEVDITDHNFDTTPERATKVLEELFCPPPTKMPVFDEDYTDLVILRNHVFHTLCPHHLLPVKIRATVAYVPNGKVIGASKLMRIIAEVNRKPMTQEALTAGIIKGMRELTNGTSKGEAILLVGHHGCFSIRGVRSTEADMVTLKFYGEFEQEEMRRRFLTLAKI